MKTKLDIRSCINIEKDTIVFTSNIYPEWTMRITDLRLLGESTNQDSPHADDYFLCFATDSSGWSEASFYSEGRDKFLNELANILGVDLSLGLAHSTDFASRILWPDALRGEPVFTFTDIPGETIIGRIFGSFRNKQSFSDQALAILQQKKHNNKIR